MDADPLRYERVWVAAWDARCAGGDARSTWIHIRDRVSRIERDPDLGPVARALPAAVPASLRLETLALDAATVPAASVGGSQPPLLAFAASKGDTGRLLEGLDPASVVAAAPGGLNQVVARRHGWRTYAEACPVAACSTGLYALLAAADALEHGRADHALCGAADASLQPLLLAGFRRLGVLTAEDTDTGPGFAPGEGAAAFHLRTTPGAWRLVAGIRLGDASHPTRCQDPAVLRRCLAALWERCPGPDAIVTHATGTRVGDRYEFAALDDGPWRAARRLVCKPVIGHCLGASSAVELAACLHAPVTRLWKLGLGFGGHVAGVALVRDSASGGVDE